MHSTGQFLASPRDAPRLPWTAPYSILAHRDSPQVYEQKLQGLGHVISQNCAIARYPSKNAFRHVFVISDLHGDLGNLILHLLICRLINPQTLEWIAPRVALVVVGDLLDRYRPESLSPCVEYKEELRILLYLNHLDVQARRMGSRVFKVIGNHELMNFMGDFGYVHPVHMQDYGGTQGRFRAFDHGGELRRQLVACDSYAMVRIGPLVFCHAGLVDNAFQNQQLEEKSNALWNQLLDIPSRAWGRHPQISLLTNRHSILNTRKLSSSKDGNCLELERAFRGMGLDPEQHRLIVGHQPGIARCASGSPCYPFWQFCQVVAEDPDRVILGGELCMKPGPHGISMHCLDAKGIPRLFIVDVASSRAFDTPHLMGQAAMEARLPSALWFDMKTGVPRVIKSKIPLPRG